MKHSIKTTAAVLIILLSAGTVWAAGPGDAAGENEYLATLLSGIELGSLDKNEQEGILLMREEEKLARDVYSYLYEKWNIPVFRNIADSEQSHMESMGLLIERYKLDDPVASDVAGRFHNPDMQKLYEQLTAEGSRSLIDALKVGAMVEDLDIADLNRLIQKSDNDDLRIVYQNLVKGSRNHLRSFAVQLDRNGAVYESKYIDAALYSKILRTKNEAGMITDPGFNF
jgi:hypothetical protein